MEDHRKLTIDVKYTHTINPDGIAGKKEMDCTSTKTGNSQGIDIIGRR